MSRAKALLIPLSLLLLASCSASKENNHDSDPISDITTDEGPNSYDEISFEDEEVVVPESLPLCEDGLISEAGSFKLSGEYSEVHISAVKKSKIYLFLDGVSINSSSGKAFYSDNNITLYVVLLNGSTNTIVNDFEDTNAFHIKGDLHIQGSGTLNITSKQKSGLKASKDLYITGESVTLNVKGNNHAIAARSVIIKKATVAVESETKDGIQAECDSDQLTFTKEQGFVYLEDAKISADTKGDGIQADTYVYVSGGEINIETEGQFVQYSSANMSEYGLTKDDFKYKASGSTYVRVATDEIRTLNSSYYALANSVKGIKAGAIEYDSDDDDIDDVTVTEGEYDIYIAHLAKVTINSTDDCIHTNYGTVTLDSSNFTLDTFDDGAHADYTLTVNNASIVINSSYEGLEGSNVAINGENTNIVATSSDDGINAASDESLNVSENNITINDGYVRVFASGDGLDANTSLYLKGGTVIVEGPGSGNGSLDAEQIYFEGGIVFACSSSGMTEKMTATQCAFAYQGSSMSSGSLISIVDSDNNTLFSYTLKQSCNQLIFSHASLAVGSSYKIKSGSSTVTTISMSSSLTKVGVSSGGGGGGNPPGGWH